MKPVYRVRVERCVYFLALATDYDGTLAHDGSVDEGTRAALERLKLTGRRLVMVTGRELPDLQRVFPALDLFDRVVAENGALLYTPASREERLLAPPPPPAFVARLRARDVAPLSVGRCIVATWEPHQQVVLDAIRELGLELAITFNKGAVMVLPAGVNKASGLTAAARDLDIALANVVGVGDAENDHAFLRVCGCSAAVANALPSVLQEADVQLAGERGAGVCELVQRICRDDAAIVPPGRHALLVGHDEADRPVCLEPDCEAVLICGSSGIGKSTLATALTERMVEQHLEFCVFDPEGDYGSLANAVSVGDTATAPVAEEVVKLLRTFGVNVVVNTQALALADRPTFFAGLLPDVARARSRTGRPHWLVIDEAHHLLAADRGDVVQVVPERIRATIFITVHPDAMARAALQTVKHVIALGPDAWQTVVTYCRALDLPPPPRVDVAADDEVLFWSRGGSEAPRRVRVVRPAQAHLRHTRKYAQGDVGDESFHFRGPEGRLDLRAQNLAIFQQIAEGVDEDTWQHHRVAGEYSRWFRSVIKDEGLASETQAAEQDEALGPAESRSRILDAVSRRYTAPASAPRD
jgi:hydroxymethylpyrimidine pyrophosphatase-like HAD family hydrolase